MGVWNYVFIEWVYETEYMKIGCMELSIRDWMYDAECTRLSEDYVHRN